MCNMMCLLSEWDENKPRVCATCSGRIAELPPQTEQTEAQDKMSIHKVDT